MKTCSFFRLFTLECVVILTFTKSIFPEMIGGTNNALGFYTGSYCSAIDGHSIHLGVFTDDGCNDAGDINVFSTINGYELPFTTTSMVNSECYSCLQASSNNEEQVQPTESCLDIYNNAARCEINMDITTKDENGCNFINNVELLSNTGTSASTSVTGCGWFGMIFFCSQSGNCGIFQNLQSADGCN